MRQQVSSWLRRHGSREELSELQLQIAALEKIIDEQADASALLRDQLRTVVDDFGSRISALQLRVEQVEP